MIEDEIRQISPKKEHGEGAGGESGRARLEQRRSDV